MSSRLDQRLKSVRSLPKGEFQKYREMFDSKPKDSNKIKFNDKNNKINLSFDSNNNNKLNMLNEIIEDEFYNDDELDEKNEKNILQLPYTDDEKSTHLKNSTNKVTKNFIYNDKPVSKFGIYPKTGGAKPKEQRYTWHVESTEIDNNPNMRFLHNGNNFKPNLSTVVDTDVNDNKKSELNNQNENQIKNEIKPNIDDKKNDLTETDSSGVKDKKDFFETRVRTLENEKTNLIKTKYLSKSCKDIDEILMDNTQNIKPPKPEYVSIEDIDLSDTSYDEESDNNSVKQFDKKNFKKENEVDIEENNKLEDNVQQQNVDVKEAKSEENLIEQNNFKENNEVENEKPPQPPPKPKRTFEHDIYINFKIDLNKTFNINSVDENEFKIESPTKPITPLAYKSINSEHIYETVGSIQNFADKFYKNNDFHSENKFSIFDDSFSSNTSPALSRSSNQSNKSNKSNGDLKGMTIGNGKKKNKILSTLKLASSEPNLTAVGSKSPNPFAKAFNKLKLTLSRKNLTQDGNQMDIINESFSDFSDDELFQTPPNNNLRRAPSNASSFLMQRIELNRKTYESLGARGHVYQDVRDCLINSLFSYVICVSLKVNETGKEKLEGESALNSSQKSSSLGSDKKTYTPYIVWQFPEDITKFDKFEPKIVEFCFPDPNHLHESRKNNGEIFQFTLTNIGGSRTYGFCLKLYSKSALPVVYCIVSPIDASEMYNTILLETKRLHHESIDDCKGFLQALYSKPLPNRGESLEVSFGTKDVKVIKLKRSYDRRLEHANLNLILEYPIDLIIKIFGSILAERKIIFLSGKLSLLSDTIQAFETLLYPFNWPHTFIPVLPNYLIEYCEAPTPFIIGLMRQNKNDLLKNDLSDVFVVDLDKHKILKEDGTEGSILPPLIISWLKTDTQNLLRLAKQYSESEKNFKLCNLFLKVFVKTMGHYKYYLTFQKTKGLASSNDRYAQFDYEGFINAIPSIQIQDFLNWFTKTQIFEVFMTQKSTPNMHFGLIFDDAINSWEKKRAERKANTEPTKVKTIKQIKNKDKTRKLRF